MLPRHTFIFHGTRKATVLMSRHVPAGDRNDKNIGDL